MIQYIITYSKFICVGLLQVWVKSLFILEIVEKDKKKVCVGLWYIVACNDKDGIMAK